MNEVRKKIYFRADANATIGYGHFVRSLALADMLKYDFDCTFFTVSPTGYQIQEMGEVCKYVSLEEETKYDDFLTRLTGEEIVWLDNYYFTSEYQKQIKDLGCKLVCIGSNDRHYYSDVVVNYFKDASEFSAEMYTTFCVGLEWCLLRKPFQVGEFRQERNHDLVICYGGTDQFFLTEKTVTLLREIDPHRKIHVIATDAFYEQRLLGLKQQGVLVHVNANASEVATLFNNCGLAIVSASTVAQEAISCGIPVVAGYYVDNQIEFYYFLNRHSYVMGIGNMLEVHFEKKFIEVVESFMGGKLQCNPLDIRGVKERYIAQFKCL